MALHPPHLNAQHALLIDFDGTLVDLAERPDAVRLDAQLPALLREAMALTQGAVALLTGRRLESTDSMLHPLRLAGAGLHGAQLRKRLDGAIVERDTSHSAATCLAALEQAAAAVPGLWVEDKGAAIAVHYRQAPEAGAKALAVLTGAVAGDPRLEIISGKFVYEARPRGFDKGAALSELMSVRPFAGRVPIAVGDDHTDEDAIRIAQAMGGFGIKVGPGSSLARYRLQDAQAVMLWLRASLETTGQTVEGWT